MLGCMSARIVLTEPIQTLTPGTPTWPKALDELDDPPRQLYLAGRMPALTDAVAIVGTRHANEDGLRFARGLARELAAAGLVIVSGGAAGIDTAAHVGALDAGGASLAVLATGLAEAYPKQNAALFSKMAQTAGLVCEQQGRSGAGGWQFLRRNRLIAAIARVVVVVQAPHRSGALSTARAAIKLKRRVFAVPSAPWDPRGTGCLQLLKDGAGVCASAADILSLAAPGLRGGSGRQRKPVTTTNDPDSLGPTVRAVLRVLRLGPCHPDGITTTLDMKAAEVHEALLTLELLGLCKQRADGNYVARSS